MMPKGRQVGTTAEAIDAAERELGRRFPPSFRSWLRENNGRYLEDLFIFPVYDERDPRKTWDSIVRNYWENWSSWTSHFDESFAHLLPFADSGSGDYFCFDLTAPDPNGESPIVLWSHETGETTMCGKTFEEFAKRLRAGRIAY